MKHEFDFLIVGSGIAGLNFALQAAEYGTVAVITKKELMESNSNYAQGGIATVLDKHDSFEQHIQDTLQAGCFLNDEKAVETMVKEAPEQINRLIKLGVGFNRAKTELALTQEGGHSAKRIAHAKDATGREIEQALIFNIRKHKKIFTFGSYIAIDLIVKEKKCLGSLVLNDQDGKIEVFASKAVVLATGGAGQVYSRNCNPQIATGDGYAMSFRAGADMENMEFIQFHPTALDKPGKPVFLLSETLRGEGGILKNNASEDFMKKYDSAKELAARDIVSRAIVMEMKNGPVYLDMRHKDSKYLKKRWPYIYEQLWWYGIKMDKDLIPVAPAAHYVCGGVKVDLQGKTNINGLFALGEVAHTGVHGANRLASNSLLECVVFSSRAVKTVNEYMQSQNFPVLDFKNLIVSKHDNHKIERLRKKVKKLMWDNAGIIRKKENMIETLENLNKILNQIDKIFVKGVNREIIELKNLTTTAILITKSALKRKESIGSHFIEKNS